ncbi:hypothetical protein GCM10011611_30360 [Aliidongia dinghuensis]|uniref:GDT1 family protein n=1 Tax=Aliidongia dinghuensis TaxID=1867774 RepID=A0A8J2YVL6_9PROT|nr:TMEM165/GDT1 family protein [Aliidongia dinghuensis]GGF22213.1 hypothetical protein GCM10011611_30360 [Aliidongia dinghuensis]
MMTLPLVWSHAGPPMLAAFLASLVEFVEALTIVLAVGTVRGWRPALSGAALGVAALVLLVAVLGPGLSAIPLHYLQLAVGVLLLLFGARWLRKAILRGAGRIALHDETLAFAKESAALEGAADFAALMTAFKAVLLEGLEVVFIVIAVGAAGGMLVPASIGAGIAGLVVLVLGVVVHRPLARVPENALKFTVGAMILSFGLFWTGEGLGLDWPGEDWSIPVMILAWLALGLLLVQIVKPRARAVVRP